ncbi:patatin-like phospholipase family protein [Desulfohalobium retbaense]|uniref:Patatin n=1 Tax=Desulfohalobium retbaense (strain ATCC 49708 / DSM 5692 / JCM 16813 / HR100) TaxID=485915 RepID=C8WZL7_DESRD|nr:patatin-like phospholipase family protein [Desulfohalobium retbaense]ACV67492.1 Patatin [Desulfohalobium retbaense DSM 5692]
MHIEALRQKKIGIALSCGAARGFAHLGVLDELDRAGIHPCCIAGSSAGALVGALYSGGRFQDYIERIQHWTRKDTLAMMDPVVPRSGLINGDRILEFNSSFFTVEKIEACAPALAVVATEALTGKELVLQQGDLRSAIRGSISIPGLFTPAPWEGTFLLDGGLVNPLPVNVCRDLGAEIIIAVDVNSQMVLPLETRENETAEHEEAVPEIPSTWHKVLGSSQTYLFQLVQNWLGNTNSQRKKTAFEKGIVDTMLHSITIMQRAVQQAHLQTTRPEFLLQPQINGVRLMDFHHAASTIEAGRQAVQDFLNNLDSL